MTRSNFKKRRAPQGFFFFRRFYTAYNDTHPNERMINMTNFNNEKIVELLKERPGRVLVTADGFHLYALSADIDGNDVVLRLDSEENLREKTSEEINQFIINKLRRTK
ncbi:hypothetical protein PBI_INGRID_37 [Arthrobacter phage Ingrid]|nr:hypothetical protein PBI_INGRID_37 [Arthrobacter phage Ingrid]